MRLKKTISILLALMLSLAPLTVCMADDGEELTASSVELINANEPEQNELMPVDDEGENPSEPENPDEPDNPDEPIESEYIAKLCICARTRVQGHVWVYVENLTDEMFTVGAYPLEGGQGVSIGTFFFSRSDGAGVYYNVEAYCGNAYGLDKTESASMLITREQLDTVNKRILKGNQWNPFFNCGFFATRAWNSVSDIHIGYGVFPFITKNSIKRKAGEGVPQMYVPTADQVFKQKGFNEKARLKPATGGTLKHKIG